MNRAAVLVALAGALACGSPRRTPPPDHAASASGATVDAGAASSATAPPTPGLGSLGLMGALLGGDHTSPYAEPEASPGYDAGVDHAAVIELEGPVVELESFHLFGHGGVELRRLTEKIAALGRDRHTTRLVLRVGDLDLGLAAAEELRAALVGFRGKGKQLLCHAESPTNVVYYLLSACDVIGLAPSGEIVVSGVALMPIHVKGALDKLGIVADFLHVGAFKGAAEPLTRDRPSAEMVETLNAIMDQAYATEVAAIAEGRKLDPGGVRDRIDRALFTSDEATAAGLVDRVATFERFRDGALAGGPWHVERLAEPPSLSHLLELLGSTPARRPSAPHLALVYAVGDVVDGEGKGELGARSEMAARPLVAALRVLGGDDAVKAIVLRVDSPGGSALASELIAAAVAEVAAKKPVIVSMGGVAASGGYYVSCQASLVFALPDTLTGSIGVVGGKLAIGGALEKLGVQAFPMGRGKRALLWSSMAPWTTDERAAIQAMMEATYRTFVARVASGRKKPTADVEALAQGRVWTGQAALAHGLVDRLGTLDDALAEARAKAGLGDDAPLEVYPPAPTVMDYVAQLGGVRLPFGLDGAALEIARVLGPEAAGIATRLFAELVRFQGGAVETVLLWPATLR